MTKISLRDGPYDGETLELAGEVRRGDSIKVYERTHLWHTIRSYPTVNVDERIRTGTYGYIDGNVWLWSGWDA